MKDITQDTIFTLLRAPRQKGDWLWLGALSLLGWLGAVALIGQFRRNQVALTLYALASPDVLFWLACVLACALALWFWLRRDRLATAALMIAAFLVGHELYVVIYDLIPARMSFPFRRNADVIPFAVARLSYALVLSLPMLIAWWLAQRRVGAHPDAEDIALNFRVGDLGVSGRDVSLKTPAQPWWRALIGGYAGFCVVMFIVMQANVSFRPLLSGALLGLWPAILGAAVSNGVAEEIIFRGLIQPAFIRSAGIACGLWLQGLLFGIMHWGLSVGLLAALPVSMLIGLGSIVWGKAALDTRGLGWVILAHALIDVAVMSAFFIR